VDSKCAYRGIDVVTLKYKIARYSTRVLDVHRRDDERIIIRQTPEPGRTCSLKEHPISVAFILLCLDFDHDIHQLINGNMKITPWSVFVFLVVFLGSNRYNELKWPVAAAATNVSESK
jgi:hypothetical protein